jgi:hypothetical protein
MNPQVLGVQAALAAMNECIANREAGRQVARARTGRMAVPEGHLGPRPRPVLAAGTAAVVVLLAAITLVVTALA